MARVRRLLDETMETTDLKATDGRPLRVPPHDFRGIFATEVVASGLPIHRARPVPPRGHRKSHPGGSTMVAPESPRAAEALERPAQGVAALTTSRGVASLSRHRPPFPQLLVRQHPPDPCAGSRGDAGGWLPGLEGPESHRAPGEHAIWILAPLTQRPAAEDEDDPAEEMRVLRGFRAGPVFDVSQTDGEPLAELPCHRLSGDDQAASYDRLRRFAHGLGYMVEEDYLPAEMNGDCNFAWGQQNRGCRGRTFSQAAIAETDLPGLCLPLIARQEC